MLSNVRQECCPTLDKGLFNVGNKLFQISENSGVKYYAIVLSNVRQWCCRSSEHAKLCIGDYFGQAVSVMVTADGWWSKGGRMVVDHRESA